MLTISMLFPTCDTDYHNPLLGRDHAPPRVRAAIRIGRADSPRSSRGNRQSGAPDLHSLQGLRTLGPTLNRWRRELSERRGRIPLPALDLPGGDMRPIGYVVLQHAVRLNRPGKAYERWMDRTPRAHRDLVGGERDEPCPPMEEDPLCLATLKHFRSLMPLAQEARKPMFALKPADGAIGGHVSAVRGGYRDFQALAREVARRCALPAPTP